DQRRDEGSRPPGRQGRARGAPGPVGGRGRGGRAPWQGRPEDRPALRRDAGARRAPEGRRAAALKLQDTSYSGDGRGLLEVTRGLAAEGWTEQATPLEGGEVRCETCAEVTPAEELVVEAFQRVEGASDPGDMAAVIAFECPHCSAHDVLIVKYGPDASAADADVVAALPTRSE